MIDWPTVGGFLLQFFGDLAADPGRAGDVSTAWKEAARPAIGDQQRAQLLLKLTNVQSVGRDENRNEFVDPLSTDPDDKPFLGQLRPRLVGMRRFTIQVQAHVVERTDDLFCMVPLDRLRSALRKTENLAKLHEQEIALIRITDSVKGNYKDGGRVMSAGSMDVIMYAAFDDLSSIPGSWIEKVVYTSHFEDVDGVELEVPPNVLNQQVPAP